MIHFKFSDFFFCHLRQTKVNKLYSADVEEIILVWNSLENTKEYSHHVIYVVHMFVNNFYINLS